MGMGMTQDCHASATFRLRFHIFIQHLGSSSSHPIATHLFRHDEFIQQLDVEWLQRALHLCGLAAT